MSIGDHDSTRMLHVLQHSLGRDQYGKNPNGRADYRNHYCASEGHHSFAACRKAVELGLMREHPPSAISGGDNVFTVTDAGKEFVAANSPPEPKRTRGQEVYRRYLAADCGMTFDEWLRVEGDP